MTFARHISAVKEGLVDSEIAPIKIVEKGKSEEMMHDEEAKKYKEDVVSKLKPAFKKDGTITGANASKINDGACSIILMSKDKVNEKGIKPLAKIITYADYEIDSVDFCVSPYYAAEKALKKANLTVDDIAFFEFN